MATRVLLIDDNPVDGRLVRLMLPMTGESAFLLDHATDLEGGFTRLRMLGADVILLDLSLQEVSGVDVIIAVRRRAPDLPIVVLTGHDDEALARQALEEGAEDYLVKGSVDSQLLVRCIRYAIERNRRRLERESLAAQMAQTDRLAAVGLLAAGIAHEINNPLTYVVGNIDLALLKIRGTAQAGRMSDPDAVAACIETVTSLLTTATQGALRVRTIVRDVNTFTRSRDLDPTPVEIGASLEWVLGAAEKETCRTAEVVRDFETVSPVMADEARLGQVFLALMLNACDAFEEADPEHNRIFVRTRMSEGLVRIEVRDNGRGIPREVLARIFEPFFTTKEVGKGTGLGLYVCRNLVRQLGGTVVAESEIGVGTCFTVLLPPAPSAPFASRVAPSSSSARLLVLDDDAFVLDALSQMLAVHFDVVAVSDIPSARNQAVRGAFDFFLCDLMLPERGSKHLYEWLSQTDPALATRTIFMTGGAFSPESQQFLRDVENPCLIKPFNVQELEAAMHQCRTPAAG